MESCNNQKKCEKNQHIFYIATICLDDSFAHSWHSLNQLHEVVTLECTSMNRCALLTIVEFQYYDKNSSNKERKMTVHHYFKTWRSVNPESLFKCSRKTIKHYDETCSHEDRHRKGRPRVTSAAENNFVKSYRPQKLQPKKMLHRVQVTDTSQHQLFRRDYMNQAFMVKLLQRNHY